jgi:hypothetical protein
MFTINDRDGILMGWTKWAQYRIIKKCPKCGYTKNILRRRYILLGKVLKTQIFCEDCNQIALGLKHSKDNYPDIPQPIRFKKLRKDPNNVERIVTTTGTRGKVFLPFNWIGKKVIISLVDPIMYENIEDGILNSVDNYYDYNPHTYVKFEKINKKKRKKKKKK